MKKNFFLLFFFYYDIIFTVKERGFNMNEYMVEFDGINDCGVAYYETDNYKELIMWIESDLADMGGGHADVYDEEGDFVDFVEV